MSTLSCAQGGGPPAPGVLDRQPVVADDSLTHAFDTDLEMRLVDRLELDRFMRDRRIGVAVVNGVVEITGEVRTPFERHRVGELVRSVAGVVDVANHVAVRSPK